MVDENHIINLYTKEYKTVNFINQLTNVASPKIKKILKENNITLRSQEDQFFCDCSMLGLSVDCIVTKYKGDSNIKQLADMYGTTQARIKRILKLKDIPLKTRKQVRNSKSYNNKFSKSRTKIQDKQEIKDLIKDYNDNIPIEEIGKKYSISVGCVKLVLKRAGISNRSRAEVDKAAVEKREKTNMERYGVKHVMQDKATFIKSFRYYNAIIQGRTFECLQGWEDIGIEFIINKYQLSTDQIFTNVCDECPSISYKDKEKNHIYYPDIYVPAINTLFEIKSEYTYKANKRINDIKQKYSKIAGYNHKLLIFKERNIATVNII